jgi:uncharacterized coiled-coil protein SlyX
MFGMKSTVTLVFVFLTVLATAGTIGYYYYKNSQSQILQLQENNAIMKVAVDELNNTINSLEESYKLSAQVITELNQTLSETRIRNRELSDRLAKHDLSLLALERPQLVERIINNASKEALRCFELLSGAPLNEKERNAKNAREFNSECSYLFYIYSTNP